MVGLQYSFASYAIRLILSSLVSLWMQPGCPGFMVCSVELLYTRISQLDWFSPVVLGNACRMLTVSTHSMQCSFAAYMHWSCPYLCCECTQDAPLVVMNNFGGEEHLKLATALFQNLFPAINVHSTSLKQCKVSPCPVLCTHLRVSASNPSCQCTQQQLEARPSRSLLISRCSPIF